MNRVVTAVRPTPILWRRASGLASPADVPASTLPARGIAPVRANIASRSVVLPLWKGPTSAMHRGPRGLLTSCPIAASSCGARPVIGSARVYALPPSRIWQGGKIAAVRSTVSRPALPSRTQFQAFKSGGDVQTDLTLQAQRLQRDRIVGTADQHVASGTDANRGAALRAGIVAGEIAGPQAPDRRKHAPGKRGFLGDAEIDADFTNCRDVTVFRHAVDTQHAAEIGDGADDEADAGPAAAFEHADLDAFRLLGISAGERRNKYGSGNAGKGDQTTHREISD